MFGACSGFPAPELLETHAALLRPRHERPCRRRAAEQRDEIAAAAHSIYLVGERQHLGWKFDAENPCSSLVDDQLELDRCLYWKVGRLLAIPIILRCTLLFCRN